MVIFVEPVSCCASFVGCLLFVVAAVFLLSFDDLDVCGRGILRIFCAGVETTVTLVVLSASTDSGEFVCDDDDATIFVENFKDSGVMLKSKRDFCSDGDFAENGDKTLSVKIFASESFGVDDDDD